jgi:hypothetical protein
MKIYPAELPVFTVESNLLEAVEGSCIMTHRDGHVGIIEVKPGNMRQVSCTEVCYAPKVMPWAHRDEVLENSEFDPRHGGIGSARLQVHVQANSWNEAHRHRLLSRTSISSASAMLRPAKGSIEESRWI